MSGTIEFLDHFWQRIGLLRSADSIDVHPLIKDCMGETGLWTR